MVLSSYGFTYLSLIRSAPHPAPPPKDWMVFEPNRGFTCLSTASAKLEVLLEATKMLLQIFWLKSGNHILIPSKALGGLWKTLVFLMSFKDIKSNFQFWAPVVILSLAEAMGGLFCAWTLLGSEDSVGISSYLLFHLTAGCSGTKPL